MDDGRSSSGILRPRIDIEYFDNRRFDGHGRRRVITNSSSLHSARSRCYGRDATGRRILPHAASLHPAGSGKPGSHGMGRWLIAHAAAVHSAVPGGLERS